MIIKLNGELELQKIVECQEFVKSELHKFKYIDNIPQLNDTTNTGIY